jgi:hypothetical protein
MRRLRIPARHPWRWLVIVLVGVVLVVGVVPTPWALHIGDRFTPTEQWDGYALLGASNGGRYVLFTHLEAGLLWQARARCAIGSCDTLAGSAKLCTRSGRTKSFGLHGDVHSEVFTPAGAIRRVTSTADAGTAAGTLRYGSSGAFASACHAVGRG